jgi:hypothetical protein
MSESREDITDEPPRREHGITGQAPASSNGYTYALDLAPALEKKRKKRLLYILVGSVGGGLLLLLVVGLVVVGVAKVREAAERSQSMNNLKQIMLSMNSVASNTSTGEIPSAYGEWPIGSGQSQSFFTAIIPYIQSWGPNYFQTGYEPVATYNAPADTRNPRTDDTVSYCTNATVLSGRPRLPGSFFGRTSSTIVVMERSGMDGAHKRSNQNNYLGTPSAPPPFPQIGVQPSAYLDGSPQGFTSAGCHVGMGDASARVVTKSQSNCWNWTCDPTNSAPQPANW